MDLLTGVVVVAAEGIPPDSVMAKLVVPLGILVFYGSVYLLVRANLGTRRGYLVMGTSFFGFMIILSSFWTFGAPGTPQATGPQNLPGQPSDHYVPKWTPFAIDSRVAEDPRFQFVQQHPADFGEVPPRFQSQAETGAEDIQSFFSSEEGGEAIGADWEPVETEYAEAPDDHPVIAVTFAPPEAAEEAEDAEAEEPAADQEPVTLFGFFDEGAPLFPGFVVIAISLAGFVLHAFLLSADEARERKEATELAEERERVPARA